MRSSGIIPRLEPYLLHSGVLLHSASRVTHPSFGPLLGVGLLCNLARFGDHAMSRLDPQQLKDLTDELVILVKQQSDARLTEVFVGMTPQEHRAFELREQRISQIHVILSDHDAKR